MPDQIGAPHHGDAEADLAAVAEGGELDQELLHVVVGPVGWRRACGTTAGCATQGMGHERQGNLTMLRGTLVVRALPEVTALPEVPALGAPTSRNFVFGKRSLPWTRS